MISVLILTKNEQQNLPDCLRSVAWCDDVVVLDSFSTDETLRIATEHGARVAQRAFTDFADQRNAAHALGLLRHDWTLHLDADERCTAELRAECQQIAAQNPSELDGFYIAPKMVFMGRWIRRSTDFPAWQARFVRTRSFRFIEVGHGQRETPEMRMSRLAASYTHLLDACSMEDWERKHRHYARAEAEALRNDTTRRREIFAALFSSDALARRRALKRIWLRLPARPFLRFFGQYFFRLGFLDRYPGLCYCRLLARYESMISDALRTGEKKVLM